MGVDIDPHAVMEIAARAGFHENGSEICDSVEVIAEDYQRVRDQRRAGLHDDHRALGEFNSAIAAGAEQFARFGQHLQSGLAGAYRSHFRRSVRELSNDLQALARLREAAEAIKASLPNPERAGRPRLEDRAYLFLNLARLYERYSGERFSDHDKRRGFRGTDFVRALARAVEPNLSSVEEREGLRSAASTLKRERKSQKSGI